MKFQSKLLLQRFSTLSGICGPSLESPVLHAPCMELCNLYTSVFYLFSVFQLYTVQWCPLLSCVFGNSRLKDFRPSKRVALLVCSRSAVRLCRPIAVAYDYTTTSAPHLPFSTLPFPLTPLYCILWKVWTIMMICNARYSLFHLLCDMMRDTSVRWA